MVNVRLSANVRQQLFVFAFFYCGESSIDEPIRKHTTALQYRNASSIKRTNAAVFRQPPREPSDGGFNKIGKFISIMYCDHVSIIYPELKQFSLKLVLFFCS